MKPITVRRIFTHFIGIGALVCIVFQGNAQSNQTQSNPGNSVVPKSTYKWHATTKVKNPTTTSTKPVKVNKQSGSKVSNSQGTGNRKTNNTPSGKK